MSAIQSDKNIQTLFQTFQHAGAGLGFPAVGALAQFLNKKTEQAISRSHTSFAIDRVTARMFASASIEMWHRAIHSFVISAALTSTSRIWASVAGYYATHYVMRSYAHLLGRFILYRHSKVVVLGIDGGAFYCSLEKKTGEHSEHKAYRKIVHQSSTFGSDPFLTVESDTDARSDAAHRNRANYHDHVGTFARFEALNIEEVIDRIQRIAEIPISALPIPDSERFADLENVQLVGYHRIVRFRNYLDALLGDANRFWNAHRNPGWCSEVVDFQVIEPQFLPVAASP